MTIFNLLSESRFALIQAWNLQATLEMQWFRLDRFSRVFYGIYSCDELLSVCRYDEVNKTTIADPELTPDPIVRVPWLTIRWLFFKADIGLRNHF